MSKVEQNGDRYITLDEGLRAGTVQVIEVGSTPSDGLQTAPAAHQGQAVQRPANGPAHLTEIVQSEPRAANATGQRAQVNFHPAQNVGNQVNQLMVVNKSGKPLYVMPGEVIVGGDQDRTIGTEMTIAPTGKPVPIDVFCVEHGRWHARGEAESASLYVTLEATDTLKAKELGGQSPTGVFRQNRRAAQQGRTGGRPIRKESAGRLG